MNEGSPTTNERKRQYSKPVLTRFPLRPEEAVLSNCKMGGSAGPGGASVCGDPFSGFCSVQAS